MGLKEALQALIAKDQAKNASERQKTETANKPAEAQANMLRAKSESFERKMRELFAPTLELEFRLNCDSSYFPGAESGKNSRKQVMSGE